MVTLPASNRRWPTSLALLVSATLHLLLLQFLLTGPSLTRYFDDSRILPALYLYSQDRHPADQRESRLPIPAPPGHVEGLGKQIAVLRFDGGIGLPPPRVRGMIPAGRDEARTDSVFSVLSVDSEVVRVDGSAAPAYPPPLLAKGMEGSVEAEFVVDSSGFVDLESIQILRSTHPEFSASVRLALMSMQFRPAWRGSHRVAQLVAQRFSFRLAHPTPDTTL